MSKGQRILILMVVLLFPSFLYILFTTGKHNVDKMMEIGPIENGELHTVDFIDVESFYGGQINTSDFKDQIVVYNFFCNTCLDSSSRSTLIVKSITERFYDKDDITYISINLRPSQWDSAQIADYIAPFNIDTSNWHFVTADSNKLANFTHNQLLLTTEYDSIQKPYGPGLATIVVVDKQQHIRGILDGGQYVDKASLISVLRAVRLEEYQKNSKKRHEQFERKRQ